MRTAEQFGELYSARQTAQHAYFQPILSNSMLQPPDNEIQTSSTKTLMKAYNI